MGEAGGGVARLDAVADGAGLSLPCDRVNRTRHMSNAESSFAIVAEPNRRAILSLLLSSERSVGEIERELRLSQPSVSKHL